MSNHTLEACESSLSRGINGTPGRRSEPPTPPPASPPPPSPRASPPPQSPREHHHHHHELAHQQIECSLASPTLLGFNYGGKTQFYWCKSLDLITIFSGRKREERGRERGREWAAARAGWMKTTTCRSGPMRLAPVAVPQRDWCAHVVATGRLSWSPNAIGPYRGAPL